MDEISRECLSFCYWVDGRAVDVIDDIVIGCWDNEDVDKEMNEESLKEIGAEVKYEEAEYH